MRAALSSSADIQSHPNASVYARPGTDASPAGGPPAEMGGVLAAPTLSQSASSRRAVDAADGPEISTDAAAVPFAGKKASRDRQPDGITGVADLNAGNAADHSDRQLPSATIAANAAASAVDKQATGQSGAPVADTSASSAAPQDRLGGSLAGRAEAVEAMSGTPQLGGGTATATRSAQGPELVANVRADTSEMAGAPSSRGRSESEPQSTQGMLITRLADGVDAPRNDSPVGALAAAAIVDAAQGDAPGVGPRRRALAGTASDGPAMPDNATADTLEKRAATLLPPVAELAVELEGLAAGAAAPSDEDSEPGPIARMPNAGPLSRMSGTAMPVYRRRRHRSGGIVT